MIWSFLSAQSIFDYFEKNTSHGIIPQSFCVLVVKFHQPPRHVMFKGEQMVVPEHQTGDVHLKRKHRLPGTSSWVIGSPPQADIALPQQGQQLPRSDFAPQTLPLRQFIFTQIFIQAWQRLDTVPIWLPVASGLGNQTRQRQTCSRPDKDKPAGTKCVRGGRSSSAGRTAPTSGLASLATSLKRSLGAKVGLLLVHSPPRTEPLGFGSLWWIWFSLLKNPVKTAWKAVLSYTSWLLRYFSYMKAYRL